MSGLTALPTSGDVISPTPVPMSGQIMAPNAIPQASSAQMVTTPQGLVAPGVEQQPAQVTMPPSGGAVPAYTRARLDSPPPSGATLHAESTSTGSSGPAGESPVPGVTPYEYGSLEARRLASRLPTSPVDLNSLPPPPTHKDRSTPNLVNGSPKPQSGNQDNQAPVTRTEPINKASADSPQAAPKPADGALPPASVPPPYNLATQAVAPVLPRRTSKTSDVVSQEEPTTETTSVAENTEVEARGIAGKFDYDVKVDYAPPPKPHRNVPVTSSKPSIPRKPTISTSGVNSAGTSNSLTRPVLPKRQSTEPPIGSTAVPASAERTFEPPPKPFRRTETQSTQRSSHSTKSSIPVTNAGDESYSSVQDVSSFPPPPVRSRPSTQSVVSAHHLDNGDPLEIHPRGRLPPSVPSTDQNESTNTSAESITGKKKAPPPTVKPKPKGLLSRASTTENLQSMAPEHTNPTGISAITEELSHIHLRKTGRTLGTEPEHHSLNSSLATKKTPPPVVPRKKDSLKHAPPVPMKSSSLRSKPNEQEESAAADKGNPFELYLKDAVPSEENRFHH